MKICRLLNLLEFCNEFIMMYTRLACGHLRFQHELTYTHKFCNFAADPECLQT